MVLVGEAVLILWSLQRKSKSSLKKLKRDITWADHTGRECLQRVSSLQSRAPVQGSLKAVFRATKLYRELAILAIDSMGD